MTIGKFLKLCAAAVFLLALFGVTILNPVYLGLLLWIVSDLV